MIAMSTEPVSNCIVPIAGIVGYRDGPPRVHMGEVTFIAWEKLSADWSELGFVRNPVVHLGDDPYRIDLDPCDVVGVVRTPLPREEAMAGATEIVAKALTMLMSCNPAWGPGARHHPPVPGAMTKRTLGFVYVEESTRRDRPWVCGTSNGPMRAICLDGFWKANHVRGFFNELNQLLSGQTTVEEDWKRRLLDTAALLGRSRMAGAPWEAFLFAMIGIERLLKKKSGQLWNIGVAPNIRSLFSWLHNGRGAWYVQEIEKLYSLRNKVAHEGLIADVTPRSAKIADEALFNLLLLSFKHLVEVKSLNALIERGRIVEQQSARGEKQDALPNASAIYSFIYPD